MTKDARYQAREKLKIDVSELRRRLSPRALSAHVRAEAQSRLRAAAKRTTKKTLETAAHYKRPLAIAAFGLSALIIGKAVTTYRDNRKQESPHAEAE